MIVPGKFTYSALGEAFEEHRNTIKDHRKKKQVEVLESL